MILFARFLQAEDPRHEIPPPIHAEPANATDSLYLYAGRDRPHPRGRRQLRRQKPNPLRRQLYVMLFGLIAATGLRVSEALALRLDDIWPDGVLHIRETKFRKSRLVPLHATVVEALDRYLEARRQLAGESDWLFPSVRHRAAVPDDGELYIPLRPATSGNRSGAKPAAAHP